ncbi:hypothetical protein DUI87_13162 [Hirundo rustica rustica]|uniref:Uncharacterized protein n=1 Tax=Hirundo rustica rustica TaxID=333673 RepID=A0A3M0KAZ7_HIRRU|nr:hypothetical protein DUI87_13162 [Hirundo rustica rustica]
MVTSSLRMNVRPRSHCHGVNRTDDVCYRVLLMSTLLLDETEEHVYVTKVVNPTINIFEEVDAVLQEKSILNLRGGTPVDQI